MQQQDSALPQQQMAHRHRFNRLVLAASTTWRRMLYMDLLIFHSSWQTTHHGWCQGCTGLNVAALDFQKFTKGKQWKQWICHGRIPICNSTRFGVNPTWNVMSCFNWWYLLPKSMNHAVSPLGLNFVGIGISCSNNHWCWVCQVTLSVTNWRPTVRVFRLRFLFVHRIQGNC